MSKCIWTLKSAAEDTGLSKRQLIRYLHALEIQPSRPDRSSTSGGATHFYILGPSEMERLRERIKQLKPR